MGRSLRGENQDEGGVRREKRRSTQEADPAGTEQPSQDGDEMDEKNGKIAHQRIVAGRRILRNRGRNNISPATGYSLCKSCQRGSSESTESLTAHGGCRSTGGNHGDSCAVSGARARFSSTALRSTTDPTGPSALLRRR